jgi:hypothetical protein
MRSGGDSVTMENFAGSGADAWDFQMYGPPNKAGQTFHEQQEQRSHNGTPEYRDHPDNNSRKDQRLNRVGIARLVLVLAVLILGCARAANVPKQRDGSGEVTVADTKAVCRTEKDALDALGKVCTVVGTYDVKEFRNQKGVVFREWPVVVLDGGGRPVLIESLWDESKKPGPDVIARYRGRRVEVTGKLHGQPPGAIANISVPCISPVESIRVVSESAH